MAFWWIESGWNGDIEGVMEGCQHNTMDVEYFDPNPQMQIWYLRALRAATPMAAYIGYRGILGPSVTLFNRPPFHFSTAVYKDEVAGFGVA